MDETSKSHMTDVPSVTRENCISQDAQIAALQAEVARLRAERDSPVLLSEWQQQQAEIVRLREQRDRQDTLLHDVRDERDEYMTAWAAARAWAAAWGKAARKWYGKRGGPPVFDFEKWSDGHEKD